MARDPQAWELISALWESYCEDLALESAQILVANANTPDDLPPALARRIALELRNDKHELSPWKLAGDGWRALTLERVPLIARQTIFNTPKPAQVDELFERAIGLTGISNSWTSGPESTTLDAPTALRGYIETRGAIAHGADPRALVTKSQISEFGQVVQRVVGQMDQVVGEFLHHRIGFDPWTVNPEPRAPLEMQSHVASDQAPEAGSFL